MTLTTAPRQVRVFAERLPAGDPALRGLSRGDRSCVRLQLRDDEGRIYFAGDCTLTVLDYERSLRGETSFEIVLQVPNRFGTPLTADPRDDAARRLFREAQPTPSRAKPFNGDAKRGQGRASR